MRRLCARRAARLPGCAPKACRSEAGSNGAEEKGAALLDETPQNPGELSREEKIRLGFWKRSGRPKGFSPKFSPETREKMARLMKERQAKLVELRKLKAARERLAKLKAELDWRKKHWSLRYYAVKPDGSHRGPHVKQDKFHRSHALIRIISGGNRSGKSTAGIAEDVAHALGYRPWLHSSDPDYKVDVKIPNRGLICGESFQEQIKKVILKKLLGDPENGEPGAIPSDELAETKKNPQGVITYIRYKNGSEQFLQSYDQDLDLFESADYDYAHFDEPPPHAIWISVQRGLTDRHGRSWLTMTPLKEPWIYDELYSRDDVEVIYADIEDNLNFGLTRESIDDFAKNLTPELKEARLRGRYFHLVGLVYKTYSDIHRIKRNKFFADGVPPHWGLWMHIDCHPKKPHHAVWVAVDQLQRFWAVAELKNGDSLNRIQPFCEAMKVVEAKLLKRRPDSIERLIDPLSGTPNPIAEGLSMWDEFDRYGFTCRPGSKNREAGILLFQDALKYDLENRIFPNFYFCDDLVGIDYEMRHYIWEDHASKKTAERKDELQTPRKKHDDFIEGIHRILLDSPYCDPYGDADPAGRPDLTAKTANRFTGY